MFYVIGHKNPDTDSICSAIAYSWYLNKKGIPAVPARCGEVNPETKFVLKKFNFDEPELIKDASGKEIILVDHNEKEQRVDGEYKIAEVWDHHKLNFSYTDPIFMHTEPTGCTATIIAKEFLDRKVDIENNISAIMLSAILSDTVIFRSPTTTENDKKMAEILNKNLRFDLEEFGKEIKESGMDFNEPTEKLILRDLKEYNFNDKKIGIGQIELIDIKKFLTQRNNEIIDDMEKIKDERKYNTLILVITDIIKKGSQIFVFGDENKISELLNIDLEKNSVWVEGLMSRKKQIIPFLEKI